MNSLLPNEQEYKWTDTEYRDHIESVCLALKEYNTDHYLILKQTNEIYPWIVVFRDKGEPKATAHCPSLDKAIDCFMDLVPKPELN